MKNDKKGLFKDKNLLFCLFFCFFLQANHNSNQLIEAARRGIFPSIERLSRSTDDEGLQAIMIWAAYYNKTDILKMLLRNGVAPPSNDVIAAIHFPDQEGLLGVFDQSEIRNAIKNSIAEYAYLYDEYLANLKIELENFAVKYNIPKDLEDLIFGMLQDKKVTIEQAKQIIEARNIEELE